MDNEQFEIRTVRSKFERVTHILVTFYVTPNAVFSETITSGLTAALKRTLPYGDISGVNPEHVIEEKIESALREWMVKNQPELISALRYKKIEVILMTQE